MTSPPQIVGFTARPFEARDVAPLQALFDEDPEYFEANGRAFPVDEVRDALPPGRTREDKFTFALERNGRVEGVIDLIRSYPEPHIWHLGLIFLSKAVRGGGAGRRCLHALYGWVRVQGGTVIRLGVVEPNTKARHLYATEGFVYETTRELDPEAKRLRRTLVLRRPL
ncbi:MAG: GNAT family N-acetyltransferase [Alphaproteobacteria bacterium]|nr:GNAT family N-acetyltransferase [Alphaproteobacteria bacterium]